MSVPRILTQPFTAALYQNSCDAPLSISRRDTLKALKVPAGVLTSS